MQTIYWLVLFVILLIIEILTMGLTTIWFAAGALAAFLAGWLGFGLAVQIVVFLVVSVVLLLLTRPIAVKYFNQERQKTNAESLIGQQGLVVEEVDTIHAKGVVEVKGQEWSAKTDEPDGRIPKNTVVVIEHNLDLIKTADHIIDLGPEGGSDGGLIIAEGTPEEIAKCENSYTGQYLKAMLEKDNK